MKTLKKPFVSGIRSWPCVLLVLTLAGSAVQSHAQIYTFSHKNSSMGIDVGSSAGIFSWQVDGVSQLAQSSLFYRVGALGPEAGIQNISAPTVNQYLNNASFRLLDVTYANSDYSVRTVYSFAGNDPGTGKANLSETLTVANSSAANMDFHFYQYSDFDLGGVPGGQSVQFSQNTVNGQYYKATQTDGSRSMTETINSAVPPIGHYEAAFFNQTLVKLNDGNPTTLNDNVSAGPGDVTFAYQWDVTLAPGGSFQISKLIAVVPEPSVSALALTGLLALRLIRRRRQAS